jgi:hypothetical protein
VIGRGRLYKEIFSPYPLLANLIFAFIRFSAEMLHPTLNGFFWLWMVVTWFLYLWIVYQVATKTSTLAALVWLAPAPLYFALLRFDIYPSAATLLALLSIRQSRYFEGAVWLGIAIALKGYALFLLPAYIVFIFYRKGFVDSVKVITITLAPFILTHLAILAFSGWEGVKAPYRFHVYRGLNGESTYDAINYVFRFLFDSRVVEKISVFPWIAQSLQIAISLLAAALRPKTFDDLLNAFLIAILGFVSFSIFHSPQFVLWIAPIVCFSRSRWLLILAITFSWMTYIYFPILYDSRTWFSRDFFPGIIIIVTGIRLSMLAMAALPKKACDSGVTIPIIL